jgi:hypothetical protein
MARYLLGVYEPVGEPPPPEVLAPIMEAVAAVADEMRAAGVWVFEARLHAPESATVVRMHNDDLLMTDGPYTEGKEHLGGFTVMEAPDLDVALGWATRFARVIGLPIEVRPFRD